MAERAMRVLIIYSDAESCASYRVRQPYGNIKVGIEFKFSKDLGDAWYGENNKKMVDAVIFQRPVDPLALQFIKEFNAKGGITIVETDDDLDNVPFSNPVHEMVKGRLQNIYRECIKEAKYLHVSTPELAVGNKSTVFYNAIDLSKYTIPLPQHYNTVIWTGSSTHYDSLELIKPVIKELLKEGVNVILMSNKQWLLTMFEEQEGLHLLDYVKFDEYYVIPSMAYISLTPLPYNKFNICKSELKILESAAWKVPCVSSDIAAYRRFNKLSCGGNVLVKKERTKDWMKAIHSLLDNPFLYKSCSEKSYQCVVDHYELGVINKKRAEWWQSLKTKTK